MGGSGVNMLIKNTEYRLFPSFSPDLAFYGKIWLFYAQKWISLIKIIGYFA